MKNNHTNFRVQAHSLTDKGRRPNNEDFVTSFEPTDLLERQKSGCIYIVADGVGGASVGERASQYAAEKVLYEYFQYPETEPGRRLKQVITRVNREIFQYAKDKGIRMATTMSVAVVLDNSLIAANVGDSRVYLIHGKEVQQITRDHNIVGELVRDGVMTEAEALKSKAKNRLTRSIGGDEEVHVDLFGPIPLQAGDKIVMCSDGLTRYALKEDIANLATTGSPEQITQNLVAFAKERGHGGADNISVITVAYEPSTELAATIQRPRPVIPEQPWERMETAPPIKSRRIKLQMSHWLIPTALLISFIGVGGLLALTYKNQLSQLIFNIISTPSINSTILTTAPTPISLAPLPPQTPTSDPNIPSAEVLTMSAIPPVPTQSASSSPVPLTTVSGTIWCPSGVKIRLNPSTTGENPKNLPVNSSIKIVGQTRNVKEEKDWYRIEYENNSQVAKYGWVWADCVLVDTTMKSQIPSLDPSGNPIDINTPQPPPSQ